MLFVVFNILIRNYIDFRRFGEAALFRDRPIEFDLPEKQWSQSL